MAYGRVEESIFFGGGKILRAEALRMTDNEGLRVVYSAEPGQERNLWIPGIPGIRIGMKYQ